MDVNRVLEQLSQLLIQHREEEAEAFLLEKLGQAARLGDREAMFLLMEEAGLRGEGEEASLLNIGNALRTAGLLREAMAVFQEVRQAYDYQLPPNDFRYVELFRNMSLLFQDMGDDESACDCLERALGIASCYKEARIEVAVIYTNLAVSKLKLGRQQEAINDLKKALSIFEMDEEHDYHYSGALSAMGEAQYAAGNLEESARYYGLALKEIERNMGRNKAYEITLQNLNAVKAKLSEHPAVIGEFESGLALCEAFYLEFGVPMIREKFPEYEGVIAAGLVGEGSECFGFDDAVSRDRDFGPGFCLWLTDSVYDEIGEALQRAYEQLPATYMGITRYVTANTNRRVGVFRIGDFYENLIGLREAPSTQSQWLYLEDYRLATAVNGKVFRDDLGEFSRIRSEIARYYPEEVRVRKIARQAALMAQSGQYNYQRMFGRGDKVTAKIALSEFMKHTMAMVYLLNRTYAPFYKWLHKGMERLRILPEIREILNVLADYPNGDERIPQTIEMIVAMIIAEMKKQGLTSGEDHYLDHHTDKILHSISQKKESRGTVKEALIGELIRLEWNDLIKAQIEGTEEQDDFQTYVMTREGIYQTWNEEMLRSYISDFHRADDRGFNLISEKYGRMLKTTFPARYQKIAETLPVLSQVREEIIEEIVGIQVKWMEELAQRYPKAAGKAGGIHTKEDQPFRISYETCQRGELSTYSENTLDLYGKFIAGLCRENRNLPEMIMTNTAQLYGYASLEELEQAL